MVSGQPNTGTISISELTETPTKGIFVNDKSIVYCEIGIKVNFKIEHSGNYRITCDPNPATPAGIRYLILNQKFSEGLVQDLTTLLSLPLHRSNGEVVVLGSGVADDLIIREDLLSGLGLERPFEVWIVPFISHNINSNTFGGHFESSDQCLHVNMEEAISITALNKIQMLFRPTNLDDAGFIEILYNEVLGTGGLPELYPDKVYNVTMINTETRDTVNIIQTGDGKERFKPELNTGEYFVFVNDTLGCESGGLSGLKLVQPPVHIYSRDDFAHQGDLRCVPVYADNFFDQDEFNIRLDWIPEDLRYTTLTEIHPRLTSGMIHIDSSRTEEGIVTFTWTDKSHNFKLVPGTKLFEICFRVLAGPGSRTEITFDRGETYFDTGNFLSEWTDRSGSITVGPDTWNVLRDYSYCYSGRDSVDITFYTIGSFPPFTLEIPEAGFTKDGIEGNEIFIENFPVGEFSYRLTDAHGNTHFASKAITISSGSPDFLSLQTAIPPECGARDGLIKLEVSPVDYQYIHAEGPGIEESYPQKNLFEGLSAGIYTFTSYDVNQCPSVPLVVQLSGGVELEIESDIVQSVCDNTLTTIELIVRISESKKEVNALILFDHDQFITSGMPFEIVPGSYRVEIKDPAYCELVTEVTVPEGHISNSVKIRVEDTEVRQVQPFDVVTEIEDASRIVSYEWNPDGKLLHSDIERATFSLDKSTWIGIIIADDMGCTFSDSLLITIPSEEESEEESSVFLPNAITPNSDGQNDQLRIFYQDEDVTVEDISVYDRYGNILFRSVGPFPDGQLWDGRSGEVLVHPGVYVVQVNIRNSDQSMTRIVKTVTVLR